MLELNKSATEYEKEISGKKFLRVDKQDIYHFLNEAVKRNDSSYNLTIRKNPANNAFKITDVPYITSFKLRDINGKIKLIVGAPNGEIEYEVISFEKKLNNGKLYELILKGPPDIVFQQMV